MEKQVQTEKIMELINFTETQDVLQRVLDVRAQRKKIYDNNWMDQEDWELLAFMKLKLNRMEYFIIHNRNEELYENRVDALIDLINYSCFLLQNTIRKNENTKV
ncbi:MAG: hypothetical protein ABH803_02605 [Candidatus Micrarchaeota archaeon]